MLCGTPVAGNLKGEPVDWYPAIEFLDDKTTAPLNTPVRLEIGLAEKLFLLDEETGEDFWPDGAQVANLEGFLVGAFRYQETKEVRLAIQWVNSLKSLPPSALEQWQAAGHACLNAKHYVPSSQVSIDVLPRFITGVMALRMAGGKRFPTPFGARLGVAGCSSNYLLQVSRQGTLERAIQPRW